MIDRRLDRRVRGELSSLDFDWGNAYVGPDGEGGWVAWPSEAAEMAGAAALEVEGRAILESPVEPLREEPAHAAALVSEARQGELLMKLRQEGEWWLVAGEDGYVAWMRSWNARPLGEGELEAMLRRQVGVYAPAGGWFLPEDGGGVLLTGGTPLLAPQGFDPEASAALVLVELVDGRRGRLRSDEVESSLPDADPERLVHWAAEMVGSSYRWGGRSAGGMDCSGLAQWAALRAGFDLPRDARQQRGRGRPVSSSSGWRAGDLLFFGDPADHVAIYDGRGGLVHARGRVVRQSLEEVGDLLGRLSAVRRLGASDAIEGESLWRRRPGV